MSVVSAIIDDRSAALLEELAANTGRSKAYHLREALRLYLDANTWQVERTRASLEEVARGEIAEEEEVVEAFAHWGLDIHGGDEV